MAIARMRHKDASSSVGVNPRSVSVIDSTRSVLQETARGRAASAPEPATRSRGAAPTKSGLSGAGGHRTGTERTERGNGRERRFVAPNIGCPAISFTEKDIESGCDRGNSAREGEASSAQGVGRRSETEGHHFSQQATRTQSVSQPVEPQALQVHRI